jgi:hypothetical protein
MEKDQTRTRLEQRRIHHIYMCVCVSEVKYGNGVELV